MKTLYLLRHAKSSWDFENLPDFERPLAPRGLKSAPVMGKLLASLEVPPQLVLSSPAKRAWQTTQLVAEVLEKHSGSPATLIKQELLYEATPSVILEVIQGLPNEAESVLLVGHNPGLEAGLSKLCFGKDTASLRLPTAGLAWLTWEGSEWNRLSSGQATLQGLITPRLLQTITDWRN